MALVRAVRRPRSSSTNPLREFGGEVPVPASTESGPARGAGEAGYVVAVERSRGSSP